MNNILASLLIFCLLGFNITPIFAADCCSPEQIISREHFDITKKAPVNTVTITNYRKIICEKNVLAINFECKFYSRKARAGDVINFLIPENIYTVEGTLVLPACSKIVAEITKVQHSKWFNENARVRLTFRCLVLPDGRMMPICARTFTADGMLGSWGTTVRIVLSTLTFGVIGTGAGVGFGFIPSPSKIGVGLAVGIPTGLGVGLLSALINKGLQYKAKAGEQIFIILTSDTSVYN